MKPLLAPKESLGDLDADTAARLLAAASDVALILDAEGRILDMALSGDEPPLDIGGKWLGKPWVETVTTESRPKVEALLKDAANDARPRWRQINHPIPGAADVPVNYCAMQVGSNGHIVAIGRDLQAMASLQQRLIEVQQTLERDYWQLRQAEARYRLLFQIASEPVLVVDASNRRVLEANPAAGRMLGGGKRELVGQIFPRGFDEDGQARLSEMLGMVTSIGRADDIQVSRPDGTVFSVTASLLRQQGGALILLHLSSENLRDDSNVVPETKFRLLQLMESAPDAVVVTDGEGVILNANRAFLELAEISHEDQVRNESLGRWLGRQGVDLEVLLANLRQHPTIRLFPTTLRGELGGAARIEVSASMARHGSRPCYGFFLRHIDHRGGERDLDQDQPRSVEQMTQLVGQVPLKELVRESTDLIEKLCIEAALQLTGDNRASAAELLGLSRQSLYVKLRRHGMMDGENGAAT